MVNDSPWRVKFFPIFIHRNIGLGLSVVLEKVEHQGFGVVEPVCTTSPLLCPPVSFLVHSSDLLDHICETLVPASQIHIHYHKVLCQFDVVVM